MCFLPSCSDLEILADDQFPMHFHARGDAVCSPIQSALHDLHLGSFWDIEPDAVFDKHVNLVDDTGRGCVGQALVCVCVWYLVG
jgi:hypothetical protein